MPKLSVWMIRAALVYLGVGFLFGALLLANKGVPYEPQMWRLLNPHIELLIFGWMIQLAMGIAFWTLPRFSNGHRYGRESLGWASFVLLNSGITIKVVAYLMNVNAAVVIGHLLVWGSIALFVVMIWSRVKPLSDYAPPQGANR